MMTHTRFGVLHPDGMHAQGWIEYGSQGGYFVVSFEGKEPELERSLRKTVWFGWMDDGLEVLVPCFKGIPKKCGALLENIGWSFVVVGTLCRCSSFVKMFCAKVCCLTTKTQPSKKGMASLEEGFYSSCGFTMIGFLFCTLYAQPTLDDVDVPIIEYAKTKDHREVYWIEDHRHRVVRIRVQFDTGVGDCAPLIQQSWASHHRRMSQKLLDMGGYARFWMGENTSFVEVSVFETHEKKALRWIRSFVEVCPK